MLKAQNAVTADWADDIPMHPDGDWGIRAAVTEFWRRYDVNSVEKWKFLEEKIESLKSSGDEKKLAWAVSRSPFG